jgi:hypothetical protein
LDGSGLGGIIQKFEWRECTKKPRIDSIPVENGTEYLPIHV